MPHSGGIIVQREDLCMIGRIVKKKMNSWDKYMSLLPGMFEVVLENSGTWEKHSETC